MRSLEPSPLTIPLSWIYGALAASYHGAFDRGLRHATKLPVPVISLGNLVAGGTGKTPAVIALATWLRDQDLRPAVLTRGYGGSRKGRILDGRWNWGEMAGLEAGDEPVLLSRRLPGVTIGVDPGRARMAAEILKHERVDVFLLDDGFQHRQLVRDVNVLLLDAERPFGNGRVLPAGPLRESPRGARRADVLLLTGLANRDTVPNESRAAIAHVAPQRPLKRTRLVLDGFQSISGGVRPRPSQPVLAVAGIARPERFRAFLEAEGLLVAGQRWFEDHHAFTRPEIQEIEHEAAGTECVLVTTAKDAVRIAPHAHTDWCVVEVSLEVEGGWGDVLARLPGLTPPPKDERSDRLGRSVLPRDMSKP